MTAATDLARGRRISLVAWTAGFIAMVVAALVTEDLDALVALCVAIAAMFVAYAIAFRAQAGRFPKLRNEPFEFLARSDALWRRVLAWLLFVVSYVLCITVFGAVAEGFGLRMVAYFVSWWPAMVISYVIPDPPRYSLADRFLRFWFKVGSLINEGRALSPEEAAPPPDPTAGRPASGT